MGSQATGEFLTGDQERSLIDGLIGNRTSPSLRRQAHIQRSQQDGFFGATRYQKVAENGHGAKQVCGKGAGDWVNFHNMHISVGGIVLHQW